MTTVYGNWAPNASQNNRMRLVITYNVPKPALNQSSVTVTGTVRLEVRYGISDVNNTFAWSGTLIGNGSRSVNAQISTDRSMNLPLNTSGGFSASVPLGSSATSRTLSVSMTGVEYVGLNTKATASVTIPIPAKYVITSPPVTPAITALTQPSQGTASISWSASPSETRPITRFVVMARSAVNASAGWVTVGTVGSSSRSLTNIRLLGNTRYDFQVAAENSAGRSGWSAYKSLNTAPAAAKITDVARNGNAATVTFTSTATFAGKHVVEYQTSSDGGRSWGAVQNGPSLAGTARSASVPNLQTGLLYRFRIRTEVTADTGGASLVSRSAYSAPIQPLGPPRPPAILEPQQTVSAAVSPVIRWSHQPVDGTAQTGVSIQYRSTSVAEWTTVTLSTSEQQYTLPEPLAPGDYVVRVATRGEHSTYSDYSSSRYFTSAYPPSVTLEIPETWRSNKGVFPFEYVEQSGNPLVRWQAVLASDTEVLETASGTESPIIFNAQLEDGTAYTVTLVVSSSVGLSSEPVTVPFVTDFLPPVPPNLIMQWDETMFSATALISNPPAPDVEAYDETAYNRLERSTDGGLSWVVVADNLAPNSTHRDWDPPLNVRLLYRVIAVTELGVERSSVNIEEFSRAVGSVLHYGPAMESAVFMTCSIQVGSSMSSHVTTNRLRRRPKPIPVFDEDFRPSLTLNVTATLVGKTPAEAERELAEASRYVILWRDHLGRNFPGVLSGISVQDLFVSPEKIHSTVTFTVEEVDRG